VLNVRQKLVIFSEIKYVKKYRDPYRKKYILCISRYKNSLSHDFLREARRRNCNTGQEINYGLFRML
jgi:hypothetical protein